MKIFKKSQPVAQVKKAKRSVGGNIVLGVFLASLGFLFFFPVLYMISQSLKPMNEMFIFPPRILVQNPTLNNFRDLSNVLANTLVPLTRYIFNSVIVVVIGSIGHIIFASMCAFPLAKYRFPGVKVFNKIIEYSLMFDATVTMIPNFITISRLGMLDSLSAIIIPSFATTLCLYLMINFMQQIPDSLLEAAQIDGAGYFRTHWKIVMPISKSALVTAFIMIFQRLWTNTGDKFIYEERLKGFSYLVTQLSNGSVTGVGASYGGILAAAQIIMF